MTDTLALPHGQLALPAFLPDATQGVVRGVDGADLESCGIAAVVMNGYHLMQRPGSTTVQALGGLHQMAGWRRPIVTDSGGFQAYSLIRANPRNGTLSEKGITFQPEGSDRKFHLTPEKSIQLQIGYGADVVICLDDPTHADDPPDRQGESVRRTITWACRCKEEYERQIAQRRLETEQRPLILGVIQGGGSLELRRECAEALLAIGFDGFGFGGWPLDAGGNLLTEIVAYVRELVPRHLPLHALGVGHPANIAACATIGYGIFDSSMPTRDARHGRLLAFTSEAATTSWQGDWFRFVYVNDERNRKSDGPIAPYCDCLCCTRYSLGYLYHLFKIGDALYIRLATMHNLRFMALLMERLREAANG
jgi:queuine tRNA-ribosyltransferase